jgi:hypothetical protein
VTRTVLGLTVLAAAIASASPLHAATLNLNQEQSAIYLACVAVATGGNLSTQITPNVLAAEILVNQQLVSQAQSLPALQGLTFIQLGRLISSSLRDYGQKQLGCTRKCTQQVLNLFVTQNQSSCLSIASGFAP